jgi:hypothetical protein
MSTLLLSYSVLIPISTFFVVIPLLVGVVFYNRLTRAEQIFTWLLGVWLITESVAFSMATMKIYNWDVYALLSFAEIIIVTLFFRQIFISNYAKKVIVWLAWIGLAIACTEYATVKGPENTITMFYECLFFFGMGLYHFFEMTASDINGKYNLIVTCMMAFFLGSGIYFCSWRFIKYDESLFNLFLYAHAYLLIICYSVFAYSLWRF